MDGGGGHPMIQKDHLDTIQKLMDKGVGLVCLHYAVEVPKGKPGDKFLDWIGGYYEGGFSTNPHWVADVQKLPDHPITRGVKPFAVRDEWYFNIRFRPEMKDVTPIVVAKPDDRPARALASPRGPYAAHSSTPRAATKCSPGRSSAPTAAAASASRGLTTTKTGATPIFASSS